MRFKHRIWLLPIMTAVIVSVGIAVNSRITSRASAALARVEQVQYPAVEALRSLRADVTKIQETLQQAVVEGDSSATAAVTQQEASARNTLNRLAALEGFDPVLAQQLSRNFDNYYSASLKATGILLGSQTGDSAIAVAGMQAANQELTNLLVSSSDKAVADFRSLLSGGAADVSRTLQVSIVSAGIMLAILGAGSWILITSVFGSLGGEPEAAVEIVRRIAGGDFTARVDVRPDDTSSLLHGIATLRTKLGDLIRDIHRSSAAVDSAAGGMKAAVSDLSERTCEQAANLEETAASMEQMTATVKQNADNSRNATELAMAARSQAEIGGAVVNRAVKAMLEIDASSKKIADIIGVIDEIAFQTNLLALNAAVEAARAGEQGRGFAVVASEVRNLAQRSSTAAREIKALIQDSVAKVQDGQTLVNESGRHLNDIVTSVKKAADIISEMSSASQEQSQGLEQVNQAVMKMDDMTQKNSAMVERTSSVADTMSEQAKQLTDIVAVFRVEENEGGPAKMQPPQRSVLAKVPSKDFEHEESWQEVA
jgi:methyl-accepting chemotaxis protein